MIIIFTEVFSKNHILKSIGWGSFNFDRNLFVLIMLLVHMLFNLCFLIFSTLPELLNLKLGPSLKLLSLLFNFNFYWLG